MDLELNDEQRALQETVRGIVAKECSPMFVRSVIDDGVDPSRWWATMVELYWPAVAIAEDAGGLGQTWNELAILLEELGRAVDPSPYLATTTQFTPIVRNCGDAEQRHRWLGGVADGAVTGALALGEQAVRASAVGDGWQLDGTVPDVVDGGCADEIALVATADDGPGVFVVNRTAAGGALRVETIPAFDHTAHIAHVTLAGVVVGKRRRLAGHDVAGGMGRSVEEATLGWSITTVGACQRVLDLVLDHVKQRHQFGVPIGSFQAVKHKAVDMYVAIQRARVLAHHAALTIVEDDPQRSVAVSMAKAAAGDCQEVVFQHGIQLFGGMGFTWENDLQIALRRAKLGAVMFGSTSEHRRRVAQDALMSTGAGGGLQFPSEAEAVRAEFAAWLDANTPTAADAAVRARSTADSPPWARRFQRAMFDAGWLLPGQPPELGGRNASLLEQFVIQEELMRRRIYHSFNPQGLSIIAPSILMFGTPEQKERWAIPVLRGEKTAALGMSEPGAGSDLAGLRTRAVADGDGFVVNGQKVWTSGAHDADFILTFVRTDTDVAKHKGISVLIVPTDTPGVTRRPFGSMCAKDDFDFNEVFFDDAYVPKENLVGELNSGWSVATGTLGEERAMLWLTNFERIDDTVRDFAAHVRDTPIAADPITQDWYGNVVIDSAALRLLGHRSIAKMARGEDPAELSILKLFGSEAAQRAANRALETLGPAALDRDRPTAPFNHMNNEHMSSSWFDRYCRSFAGTIAGGTSEIQRNIIAERILGLPR